MVGDDIFYALDLRQRGGQLWHLPGHMAAVWFGCNGRLGEMLIPIWIEMLPRWLSTAIAFAATIILPLTAIRLAGLRRQTDTVAIACCVALTVLCLPWWDMGHLVCVINYPWGACIALLCLIALFERSMHSKWWLLGIPFAFLSGAYHEALGAPLAAGLAVWLLYDRNWRKMSVSKKLWIVAIIAGGMFTLSSPAIWARATSMNTRAYSPLYLLITSANLSVILLVITAIIAIFNRNLFKRLLSDTWLVFFISSIASACITSAGDTIGRAGFFAQIFSIIAFGRMYVIAGINIKANILATIGSCLIYILLTAAAITEYVIVDKVCICAF